MDKLQDLQRYVYRPWPDGMSPEPDGDWLRYEDVEKLLGQYEQLSQALDSMHQTNMAMANKLRKMEQRQKLMNGWRQLPDLPEKGQLCLVEGRGGGIYFGQFMPNEDEPLGFDWWAPVVDRRGNEVFASSPWDQSYEIDNIRLEGAKDPEKPKST